MSGRGMAAFQSPSISIDMFTVDSLLWLSRGDCFPDFFDLSVFIWMEPCFTSFFISDIDFLDPRLVVACPLRGGLLVIDFFLGGLSSYGLI